LHVPQCHDLLGTKVSDGAFSLCAPRSAPEAPATDDRMSFLIGYRLERPQREMVWQDGATTLPLQPTAVICNIQKEGLTCETAKRRRARVTQRRKKPR